MASLLESRLDLVREVKAFSPRLFERMQAWIENAPEEELYRINPLMWANRHGVDDEVAVNFFLHASRAGIFDMVWSALCTQCGMLVTSIGGLRSMGRSKRHCRL